MRRRPISDDDGLFRHTIHPVAFKGGGLNPAKAMNLRVRGDGSILGSLAWERYLPTTAHVHGHGCRLAFKRNANVNFEPRKRQIYCGAYRLNGGAVRALTADIHEVLFADVVHHPENGEIAHTDLRIVLRSDTFDVEGTKTAIVVSLWNSSSGPLRHICNYDTDINPHPSSLLPTAAGGAYSDSRTRLERYWFVLRFWILDWLCHRLHNEPG